MTNEVGSRKINRAKASIYLMIAGLLTLVIVANWHLVYVAVTSQPDCVAHVQQDAGKTDTGAFSAARSACTPP